MPPSTPDRRELWAQYDRGDVGIVDRVLTAVGCGVMSTAAAQLGVPVRSLWYRWRTDERIRRALAEGRTAAGLDEHGYRRGTAVATTQGTGQQG